MDNVNWCISAIPNLVLAVCKAGKIWPISIKV